MVPHQLADPLRQDAADYPIERLALSQDRSCWAGPGLGCGGDMGDLSHGDP